MDTLVIITVCSCLWISTVNTITRNFVTQLCPGTVGPSYGDVFHYHPDSLQDAWVMPISNIDCWVTIRGFNAASGTPQRYATLQWRDTFSIIGYNTVGCSTAYMEIYEASSNGVLITPAKVGPVCGTTLPADVTTTTNTIVIRLYVEAPPAGTYSSTIISASLVSACNTTTSSTNNDTTVSSSDITIDTVTTDPNTTDTTTSSTEVTTSGCQNISGPYINFTADFTSYFVGSCSLDTTDDSKQLYCSPGTGRCIDISLRCDALLSNNCGDEGDIRASPPGNCTVSTTEPPTTTSDLTSDLLPLWVMLGLLATLAMLYWCCWRPGWFPWRLARFRNVTCCKPLCRCCSRTCGTKRTSSNGCFGKCCGRCSQTSSGYPYTHEDYARTNQGGGGTRGDRAISPFWMNFSNDDGAHVREMR